MTTAKACRLLKAILNTALDDGVIRRNPCRIKGAGQNAGTTLRELMDRMGHDSRRAAMIYLHGSDARQHQIADSLSKLTRAHQKGRLVLPGVA